MPRTIPLNPENKAIHAQIGKAIEAFAMVEGAQAMLIQKLLNIDLQSAYAIFFAVQNVPSRNEMLTTLIRVRHGGKYDSYWRSCRVFLQKLAEFRNALAHWHPVVSVFTDKEMNERRFEYEIMDIRPSKSTAAIGVDGISPFIEDCRIIQQALAQFAGVLGNDPQFSQYQDAVTKPMSHRNKATIHTR